jgi:hypothetical protein
MLVNPSAQRYLAHSLHLSLRHRLESPAERSAQAVMNELLLHSSYLSIVILLWSVAAGVHRKDSTADSCRTVEDFDVASAVSRVDCADTGISIVDVEK